jgi:hypothetical protein
VKRRLGIPSHRSSRPSTISTVASPRATSSSARAMRSRCARAASSISGSATLPHPMSSSQAGTVPWKMRGAPVAGRYGFGGNG